DNATTVLGPVAGYETEAYYQTPKKTGNSALMEPFKYNLAGKDILQTAVAVPIKINGRFVGVAGIGVALADLQQLSQSISIYETGYASILSNGGIFLGDKEAGNIGKKVGTEQGFEAAHVESLLSGARTGQRHQVVFHDPLLKGAEATVVQVPMTFAGL